MARLAGLIVALGVLIAGIFLTASLARAQDLNSCDFGWQCISTPLGALPDEQAPWATINPAAPATGASVGATIRLTSADAGHRVRVLWQDWTENNAQPSIKRDAPLAEGTLNAQGNLQLTFRMPQPSCQQSGANQRIDIWFSVVNPSSQLGTAGETWVSVPVSCRSQQSAQWDTSPPQSQGPSAPAGPRAISGPGGSTPNIGTPSQSSNQGSLPPFGRIGGIPPGAPRDTSGTPPAPPTQSNSLWPSISSGFNIGRTIYGAFSNPDLAGARSDLGLPSLPNIPNLGRALPWLSLGPDMLAINAERDSVMSAYGDILSSSSATGRASSEACQRYRDARGRWTDRVLSFVVDEVNAGVSALGGSGSATLGIGTGYGIFRETSGYEAMANQFARLNFSQGDAAAISAGCQIFDVQGNPIRD